MELEFDKEIDAILRKVREPVSVRAMDANGGHLDADAIAAFAENALPEKAKNLYIMHFADCDKCRRVLSNSIQMMSEAQPTFASTAAAPLAAETVVPWYQKLFGSSNLALAMGALAVVFSGVLGYIVIQNRNSGTNATVARVTETAANAPNRASSNSTSTANMAANTMAAANAGPSNTVAPMISEGQSSTTSSNARPLTPGGPNMTADKDAVSGADAATEPAKPTPAAVAPPSPVEQPATIHDDKKAEVAKEKADMEDRRREASLSKTSTDQISRDALPAAKRSGPNSKSVQNNTQQQMENSNVAGMFVPERKAGGKTFQMRDGAWYDTAYHGQPTVNVARGTEEYKKLDGGLRKIGDSVGGTVVVVWKSKAYRIQ